MAMNKPFLVSIIIENRGGVPIYLPQFPIDFNKDYLQINAIDKGKRN